MRTKKPKIFGLLALLALLGPGLALAGDSRTSTGNASFVVPPDCRAIQTGTQVVQACGIGVEKDHSIIVELREAWKKTGAKDAEGVTVAVLQSMIWPEEYGRSIHAFYKRPGREQLTSFDLRKAPAELMPKDAAACQEYALSVEDRSVPGHAGVLFIRQETGLLCAASAVRTDGMYVHQTWLSLSERYSPALGQAVWSGTKPLTRKLMTSLDLGHNYH